jgi:hypothetical protein
MFFMASKTDHGVQSARPLVYGFGNASPSDDYSGDTTSKKGVPVTILTGFLGSGKTTLLNRFDFLYLSIVFCQELQFCREL